MKYPSKTLLFRLLSPLWFPMSKPIDGHDGYYVSVNGTVYRQNPFKVMREEPNSMGYLRVEFKKGGIRTREFIHRLVAIAYLGLSSNGIVDHIDGNKTNNKASNLRVCTRSENMWNARTPTTNTSGFKGAYWDKRRGLWLSLIRVCGKSKHLGRFTSAEEAHLNYCMAACFFRGVFAKAE